MFTNQVRQISALPPPPNAPLDTAKWWEDVRETFVHTFGDCNQELEHNGPIVINGALPPTTFNDAGEPIPLPPFTPETVNFHNESPLPPAQFTIYGNDSRYDPITNLIEGGVTQINGGVSIFEDLIVRRNVRIEGDLVVVGNCSCDSGGGGGDGTGSTVKQFTLTADLLRFGTATALVDGAPVVVTSVMGQYGAAGRTGWAVKAAAAAYDILWLDNEPIRFKLLSDLALGGTATAKQVVGVTLAEVGPSFSVRSWHTQHWLGRTGALGTAIWFQDDPSAAMVIDLEHDAEWIVVRAKADMPAGGELPAELVRFSRGRAPVAVGANITVHDKDNEFGLVRSGDLLYCVLWDQGGGLGEYHIQRGAKTTSIPYEIRYDSDTHSIQVRTISATVHCFGDPGEWSTAIPFAEATVEPLIDWRIDGFNYDFKRQRVFVPEVSPEGPWETAATGGECDVV